MYKTPCHQKLSHNIMNPLQKNSYIDKRNFEITLKFQPNNYQNLLNTIYNRMCILFPFCRFVI